MADKKPVEKKPAPEVNQGEVLVELKRSHWIGDERHDPPELMAVSFDEALRLIEKGVAGRTDALKAD